MTTPAVSILDQGLTDVVSFSQKKGSSTVNRNVSNQSVSPKIQVRPKSSTSPFRSNGTRAPMNWGHEWSASTIVPGSYQAEQSSSTGWRAWGDMSPQTNARALYVESLSWLRDKRFPIGVEQAARTQFLSKLAGRRADLGAALGELRQTARGVTDASQDIVRGIDYLARKYRKTKRAIVNEIRRFGKGPIKRPSQGFSTQGLERLRNEWLRQQFGVKPLIGTIDDAGKALSDAIFEDGRELNLTVRAGASNKSEYVASFLGNGSVAGKFFFPFVETTQCHYSAVYRVPISADRTLQELGLGNPYSVAWELTQLSWMVDYLLGVGDWLDSLTADWGAHFVEGSVSRIQRATLASPVLPVELRSDYIWTTKPRCTALHVSGKFERTVLATRVLPAVMPSVRNQLGISQMANSLSVLSQLMGRTNRR